MAFSGEAPRRAAEVLDQVRRDLGDAILSSRVAGDGFIEVATKPESLLNVCRYLKESPRVSLDFLSCVSAVDLGTRFESVYHLHSLSNGISLRLKAAVPASNPTIDSVASIWPTANWHEREAFDLFGISFTGHPDLRRIMLEDDFEGHPMRKSYLPPQGRPAAGSAGVERS